MILIPKIYSFNAFKKRFIGESPNYIDIFSKNKNSRSFIILSYFLISVKEELNFIVLGVWTSFVVQIPAFWV